MVRQRGKFITFEGLDGVGKSTQLENLAGWLRERGIDVVTTPEPGGTAIGQKLRGVLLSSRTEGLSPLAELALMFADRAQHLDANWAALRCSSCTRSFAATSGRT